MIAPSTNDNPLLRHALEYLRRGWSIIPLGPDKTSLVKWENFQRSRPTETQLVEWFAKLKVVGIGVVCGSVSGNLAVRDFDDRQAYARWAISHPDLAAKLPTVATARGYHVYCRSSSLRSRNVDGGEWRGEKNYVVLPPSLHPSGINYKWVVRLPAGDLPEIEDPCGAGLAMAKNRKGCCIEDVECAESTDDLEDPDHSGSPKNFQTTNAIKVLSEDQAIEDTLPIGPGQRYHQVFRLARYLRSIKAFQDADPAELETVIRKWHAKALPFINTKEFEETYLDFLVAWENVKYPFGSSPLEQAMARADASPRPQVAAKFDGVNVQRLVALCAELQRMNAGRFFLDIRAAARTLGESSPMSVHRWLQLLMKMGILKRMVKGERGSASEYEYCLPLDPVTKAVAGQSQGRMQ